MLQKHLHFISLSHCPCSQHLLLFNNFSPTIYNQTNNVCVCVCVCVYIEGGEGGMGKGVYIISFAHLNFCSFLISSILSLKNSLGRSKCVTLGDDRNTCRFLSSSALRGVADVSSSLWTPNSSWFWNLSSVKTRNCSSPSRPGACAWENKH